MFTISFRMRNETFLSELQTLCPTHLLLLHTFACAGLLYSCFCNTNCLFPSGKLLLGLLLLHFPASRLQRLLLLMLLFLLPLELLLLTLPTAISHSHTFKPSFPHIDIVAVFMFFSHLGSYLTRIDSILHEGGR